MDLDEHSDDSESRENERERKPIIHRDPSALYPNSRLGYRLLCFLECQRLMTPDGGCGNDVGRDGDPKGVLADKWDLDEYPDNSETHENERERKSVIHRVPRRGRQLGYRSFVSELARLMMSLCDAPVNALGELRHIGKAILR
jgi:hypothetical protein